MKTEINHQTNSDDQPTDLVHRITNYLIKNSPGMRVIKTVLAIMVCLMIEYYRGSNMPYHACIATIVCMQPTLKSTLQASLDRTLGTIIAGTYAYLLAILLIGSFGMLPATLHFYLLVGALSFPLMALMIGIKKPGSLAITVIVYLVIMVSVNATNALPYTIQRVTGTLIGIAVALFINWLPPLNKIGKRLGKVNIGEAGETHLETQNR